MIRGTDKLIKKKKNDVTKSMNIVVSPLSTDEDPRVKTLKKELEKLQIKTKPKYIKFVI